MGNLAMGVLLVLELELGFDFELALGKRFLNHAAHFEMTIVY